MTFIRDMVNQLNLQAKKNKMAQIFKMIPALIFLNFEIFVLTCCFEIIAALPETLEHSSDFSGRFLMG